MVMKSMVVMGLLLVGCAGELAGTSPHPTEDRSSVDEAGAGEVPATEDRSSVVPRLDGEPDVPVTPGGACAPDGPVFTDGVPAGWSYSCTGPAPRGVGTCRASSLAREAYGSTWTEVVCEALTCPFYDVADYRGLHARCGASRPHARACFFDPREQPGSVPTDPRCELHGASWGDGVAYGAIWCCP